MRPLELTDDDAGHPVAFLRARSRVDLPALDPAALESAVSGRR